MLKLSPQQMHLLSLLQLNPYELDQRIQDEISENPALEQESATLDAAAAPEPFETEQEPAPEKNFELLDAYHQDDEQPEPKTSAALNHPSERPDWSAPLVSTKDFREQIHDQLSVLPISSEERTLAAYLVDSLEDDGYLRQSLADLADSFSFAQGCVVEEADLEAALELVQDLEPAGIGARDLRECLLLQLEAKQHQLKHVGLAYTIVSAHLDDFAQRNLEKIAQALGTTLQEIELASVIIERLTPRPAGGNTTELVKNRHIIPEFLIEKEENGAFRISLSFSNSDTLRLSSDMSETFRMLQRQSHKNAEKAASQYIRSKLDAAIWFIDMVRQRENSMLKVMHSIVALQMDFFYCGDEKTLRPMGLKDIAEQTGLDISTISRVTSTKYALTDFGLVQLRSLFHQGMERTDGEWVTQREISDLMAAIIQQEDKTNPLSDQQLAAILGTKGYPIARRTVAKYRDALHLPNAKLRLKTLF